MGDHEGLSAIEDALDRAKHTGRAGDACLTSSNLGESYRLSGDPERSLAVFADGVALAEEHELLYRRNCLLITRSTSLLLLDRWDEAADDARDLLGQSAIASHHRGLALVAIGRVRARRGDGDVDLVLDEALELLEPIGDPQYVYPVRIARIEAAWLTGDVARARAELELLLDVGDRLDLHAQADLCRWTVRIGLDWTPPSGGLARSPIPDVATDGWRAVADYWAESGCSYEAADALAESDDEADLREAFRRLTELGARPRAQQVARRLRDLGVKDLPRGPHATTRANSAGLTVREVEVAALLADAHTNREIADRLFLSPKTVDNHVSAVLAKFGVSSRRHVASAASRAGISLAN